MTATTAPYNEPEVTEPIDLVGVDGKLNRAAVAWSRQPLHRCNLPASLERKKRWNYWAVTSDDLLFSATIADVDRAQVAGAYLYHRATERHINTGAIVAPGTITMPEFTAGDIRIEQPRLTVAMTDEGDGTRIVVDAPDFGGMALHADIHIERPGGHETLGVVIPWSDLVFQYTSKQNTLPASGVVQLGDERLELRQPAFGCLDYGRGVWPEHTLWNWGSASAVRDGRTIGMNLGDKWTDGTGMNENALCIDGRLTKISEDLIWDYDRSDWMRPWRIRTAASDRIDLVFTPEHERADVTGDRDGWFTEAHQMFGVYNGRITPDDGPSLQLRDLFGWAEEHEARW